MSVLDEVLSPENFPPCDPLPGAARAELAALRAEVGTLTDAKDNAYSERNQLVCALSKFYPASLERHPDEDTAWEDDWRWIVFIDLPTGQASWHIHDAEVYRFDHLERNTGRKWDGHTTFTKYERVAALTPDVERAALRARVAALEGLLTDLRRRIEPSQQDDGGHWAVECVDLIDAALRGPEAK